MAVIVNCQTCFSRWRDTEPLDPAFGACSHIMKAEKGHMGKAPRPLLSTVLTLLSQGMVRPGVVQGPHWGRRPYRSPVPPSHADPRLANRVLR